MNSIFPIKIVRSQRRARRLSRNWPLFACVSVAILLGLNVATAAFHLWTVTEVYSSPDGSVQFIELKATANSQQNLGSASATITSTNSSGMNTFTFPTNLPSSSTVSKTMILGTANLASVPGGVTPNYIIPANFIRPPVGGGSAAIIWNPLSAAYPFTSLPADGDSALFFSGATSTVGTNLMVNFSDETNTIVPVVFTSAQTIDTNFVMSFPTATGVNGSAGPTYAVEYKNLFTDPSWTTLTSVQGDGTTQSASNATASASQQFFRLNVH
jgi:hypothetical protein